MIDVADTFAARGAQRGLRRDSLRSIDERGGLLSAPSKRTRQKSYVRSPHAHPTMKCAFCVALQEFGYAA